MISRGFIEEWRLLLATPGSGRKEVGGRHPLRLIYGANERGEALFFVITDVKPGMPELSRAVRVERGIRRLDDKWTLSLTLIDDRYTDVFMHLAEDLVGRSARGTSEFQALALLLSAIDEWKHLLRSQLDDRLPLEAIRGLVAELWFGFRHLSQTQHAESVLGAWTGPLGSPQDFRFPMGPSYEVKSVHPDSRAITVSSAEQLDVEGGPLALAVVTLVQVAESVPEAMSLRSLADVVEQQIRGGSDAIDQLHRRFDALRFDANDQYYDDFWFVVTGLRQFEVTPDFPAIRSSLLRNGIRKVTYSLELSSISAFEIILESHMSHLKED